MERENKDNDVLTSRDTTSDLPAPQETAPPAPQVQAESFAVQSAMGEKPEGEKAQLFNEEGSSSVGENPELTKAQFSNEGRQSLKDELEKTERILDEALKISDAECGESEISDEPLKTQDGAGKLHPVAPPKRKRKWIWNLVLIAVLALGIYSMFGISGEIVGEDGLSFSQMFASIDGAGMVLLLGVILGVMLMDWSKFLTVNKAVLGKVRPLVAIKTSLLGKFYDGITPFSTGGQPMQIYYMTTKGIGGAESSAIVLIRYFGSMFAFTVLGAAFMIAGAAKNVLAGVSGSTLLLVAGWVGLAINFLLPLFILFFVLFPRLARKLTGWFIFVGVKLKIVKHKERTMRKALRTVKDFIHCFRIIVRRPVCLVLFLLCCFAENFLTLSVPFFVMNALSCPLDGMFFTIIALNVFTTFGVSFIPTPGNTGVIEGMGVLAFSAAAGATLAWSVLFWRFSVYYIYILIGIVWTITDLFRKNLGKRRRA